MFTRLVCLVLLALTALTAASQAEIFKIPDPDLDPGLPLAPPTAAAVTTPSAPAAWGGPRPAQGEALSERVVQYAIDVSLDPERHLLSGREQLTWRNRSSQPVRSVYLHLYLNAFRDAGSTFFTEGRQQHAGFRSGMLPGPGEWGSIDITVRQGGTRLPYSFVHPDGGPSTDRTLVRVDLAAPVAGGASTTLDIGFAARLPRIVARTGYFGSFHLVGQWFPKIAVLELPGERGATAVRWNAHEFHMNSEFYADFGSYDVRIRVPRDYQVGATGVRQGAPQPMPDGSLVHHYRQDDVHDFAWTADRRFAAPLRARWQDVDVTVLYHPEMADSARRALASSQAALDYFGRKLGPYPYRSLTVVIPPLNAGEAGGMEYPTFITGDGNAGAADGSITAANEDATTIHEFGHNYFYGILASNEFEEPMLDEGVNEYWQNRMLAERGPALPAPAWARLVRGLNAPWPWADFERSLAPLRTPTDAPGANAWQRIDGLGPIYARTATVLRDIEAQIGTAALDAGFRLFYTRWRFRHPSVADLREALAEASGQRAYIEAMFARQIYRSAAVDDAVEALYSARLPGSALYESTLVLRRRGAAVPQEVVIRFADGSSERLRWDDDDSFKRYHWRRAAPAVSARIDPDRQHALDVNKFDDSRTSAPDGRASRHWSVQAATLFQLLLALIASV
ncbi:M1 family metallopeptidase [Massilia sp. TS11]|uniref:M1 family metallopeptidase n=1 Tax=Massilia sp. TS11 TaxID=2908003 RepID=UPI001EDA14D6|nr:M1 family metallopeptidase [Massilia sp. TS11]MCG2585565.1 M1 family metallopeptidase [Massilia sp. TS11]